MPEENPYWTACRRALGREPENWEFLSWVDARWNEFMAGKPGTRQQYHREFGDWLERNPFGLPF